MLFRSKNRLSGHVLAGISIKTEQGSQAKTGLDGSALLVLPSDSSEVKATISGDTIVTAQVTIRAVQDDSTNLYKATPAGRIYMLSKASGTIDVVKTNLDGTDRQIVLAGTGKEDDGDTVLLASKNWKYLALKSHRDGALAKLYVIDTTTDKVDTIDDVLPVLVRSAGVITPSYIPLIAAVRMHTGKQSGRHSKVTMPTRNNF